MAARVPSGVPSAPAMSLARPASGDCCAGAASLFTSTDITGADRARHFHLTDHNDLIRVVALCLLVGGQRTVTAMAADVALLLKA